MNSERRLAYIDLDKGTIAVKGYKRHCSKVFKLKSDTSVMLREYVQRNSHDKLFPDSIWIYKMWRKTEDEIAEKLKGPHIKSIRLYDLRH